MCSQSARQTRSSQGLPTRKRRGHGIARIWQGALLLAAFLLLSAPAQSQDRYISRYDFFAGYTHLNSPAIHLPEHGIHLQFGVRPKTWYSLGFDYSNSRGDLRLTPDMLPTALQQQLGAQLAQLGALGLLPAGYSLQVPARSVTNEFAAGPQFSFHHFRKVTFFIRPSLGAIHENATPTPKDPIAQAIVKQLAPRGKKTDWQGFYGAGGGIDLNASKHVALRIQMDYVYDHLFNDILRDGRRTVRLSIGPAFNFGKNIVE